MPSTPTAKSTGFLYSWTAMLYLLQRHRLSKPRRPVLLWALRYSAFYAIIQAFANFDVWIISMDVVVAAWITFPFNLFSRLVLVFSNFVVFFICFLTCPLFYFFLVWNALGILGFALLSFFLKKNNNNQGWSFFLQVLLLSLFRRAMRLTFVHALLAVFFILILFSVALLFGD